MPLRKSRKRRSRCRYGRKKSLRQGCKSRPGPKRRSRRKSLRRVRRSRRKLPRRVRRSRKKSPTRSRRKSPRRSRRKSPRRVRSRFNYNMQAADDDFRRHLEAAMAESPPISNVDRILLSRIRDGYGAHVIENIIKQGANVNRDPDYDWDTPLNTAIQATLEAFNYYAEDERVVKNYLGTIDVLIAHGADINKTGSYNLTPLYTPISRADMWQGQYAPEFAVPPNKLQTRTLISKFINIPGIIIDKNSKDKILDNWEDVLSEFSPHDVKRFIHLLMNSYPDDVKAAVRDTWEIICKQFSREDVYAIAVLLGEKIPQHIGSCRECCSSPLIKSALPTMRGGGGGGGGRDGVQWWR